MKKLLIIIFGIFLSCVHQQSAQKLPETPRRIIEKDGIYSEFLENGLEVILLEDHGIPLTTVIIASQNGAYTETPKFDGLTHLYEHMFFKANRVLDSQEKFRDRARELGLVWNGTTSTEAVRYYSTAQSKFFCETLEFMANAIRYPMFQTKELENERPVVNGEYDRKEANPYSHFWKAMDMAMFGDFYVRKNTIGDRKVIATATVEQMQFIKDKFYVPNNCALILHGDFERENALNLVNQYFGDWEKGENPHKNPPPEHPFLEKSQSLIVHQPIDNVMVSINFRGPDVLRTPEQTHDTFAADMIANIARLPNSRFMKNLVESGVSTNAWVGYRTLKDGAKIYFGGECPAENFAQFQTAMKTEMLAILEPKYFTEELIKEALNALEIEMIFFEEKGRDYALSFASGWCSHGTEYWVNYMDNMKKVTVADLESFAQRYFNPATNPMVYGILASEENADKVGIVAPNLELDFKKGESK